MLWDLESCTHFRHAAVGGPATGELLAALPPAGSGPLVPTLRMELKARGEQEPHAGPETRSDDGPIDVEERCAPARMRN